MNEKELLPSKGYGMAGLGGTGARPFAARLNCSKGCNRPRHGRYTTCQVCQIKIWRGAALKGWRTRKRMARARNTA